MPFLCLVSNHYYSRSVIDWAFAGMVPLPRAAGLPRFLWGPSLSPTAQKDRQSYIALFASQDSLEASHMRHFQSDQNLEFRTLFIESLFSKNAHLDLARNGWKVAGGKLFED
jgi:hypothetical protein